MYDLVRELQTREDQTVCGVGLLSFLGQIVSCSSGLPVLTRIHSVLMLLPITYPAAKENNQPINMLRNQTRQCLAKVWYGQEQE